MTTTLWYSRDRVSKNLVDHLFKQSGYLMHDTLAAVVASAGGSNPLQLLLKLFSCHNRAERGLVLAELQRTMQENWRRVRAAFEKIFQGLVLISFQPS